MAQYRIICANRKPCSTGSSHTHIIAVGTGTDGQRATINWTVNEVLSAMQKGDTFYIEGENTGEIIIVGPRDCYRCGRTFIRPTEDQVADNSLADLPNCQQ
jgi:hypothetical protein